MVSALLFIALMGSALVQMVVPGMVGGPTLVPRNSEKFNQLVEMAATHVTLHQDSNMHMWTKDVISVTQQVVAGIMYNIHFTMDYTMCSKDRVPVDEVKHCRLADGANDSPDHPQKIHECHVQILDRSWDEGTQVVKAECSPIHF